MLTNNNNNNNNNNNAYDAFIKSFLHSFFAQIFV